MFEGEVISLVVAVLWTVTAIFSEGATRRLGTQPFNLIRLALATLLLALGMWFVVGSPLPRYTTADTWLWLSLSGLVGFVAGDICLFNSYLIIGSRFGQLLMTVAPIAAAIAGWILLGETMSATAFLAMLVVTAGIAMSVLNRGGAEGQHRLMLKLPLKGVLYGLGAGVGQGVGLVLSKMGIQAYDQHLKALLNDVVEGGNYVGNHWDLEAAMSYMPYAATFIRALTGVVGFAVVLTIVRQWPKVWKGLHDRQAMKLTMGAVVCGPTIGVSLSLLATLYTSTGVAQTLMSLTPIIILLPAWLWQHQRVTRWEVIGAIIAVAGAALFFV